MQVTNCGRGIHKNEVEGVDQFKKNLPSEWFAFTNLDLAFGPGMAREIDVIMVTNKRVLIIDLKNWNGAITGADGRWLRDGVDEGPSPVAKVTEVARHLYILLKRELDRRPETKKLGVPKIDGLVVLTGNNDASGIPATEREKVLTAAQLLKALSTDELDRATFGNVSPDILARPLVGSDWKQHLTRFFNAGNNSRLKPGRRKFQRFVPEERHVFEHPKQIYREYEAKEDGTPPSLGTLRLWDFEKVEDTRFQVAEVRAEIAGRERKVFHWLRDRSDAVDALLLSPRTDDPTGGVRYWEVYDRRKRLKRLSDWVGTEAAALTPSGLVELARQFLSHLAELHRLETFHLDLGAHSIWLEAPTTVRLSHLFAARHPDVSSLGETRYHFLSSVQLPEDVIGGGKGNARRDVFLAAGVIHQILFGSPPANDPLDWDPGVDPDGTFSALHDWFAEALDHDAKHRFFDARSALEAFNKATVEHPTPREVQDGLERFRGKTRSQLALLTRFPMIGEALRDSDRADVWRSMAGSDPVVVKMWKQAAWGDLEKEGKRILAFLERAADAMTDVPPGVPRVRAVFWLGDAFAVVQDWVEGPTLATQISDASTPLAAPEVALEALRAIELTVSRLHEAGYAHGDIKPENVVRDGSGGYTLIDTLDFAPLADGELQNGAYSSGGDTFERDRSAVLKVASEVLAQSSLPPDLGAQIERAIETCRQKEPRLSTLLPFSEAIERVIAELAAPSDTSVSSGLRFAISVRNAEVGELESDEGRYFLRSYGRNGKGPASVLIRGAVEEIEFRLDTEGVPKSATRRNIGQTSIAIVARHEVHSFVGSLAIVDSTKTDLRAIQDWMLEPTVAGLLTGGASPRAETAPTEEELAPASPEEEAEEAITEEVAAQPISADPATVDVPLLWRELIDIERELTTEAVVVSDSAYDATSGRHKVAIELESGAFDFDRNDRVTVQRQVKGGWRRIGDLDVGRSLSTVAYLEVSHFTAPQRTVLLEAGQRLRFVSHFEAESLRRRSDAVGRILSGQGRAGNLVSVFDPRSGAVPHSTGHTVEEADLAPYELNPDQAAAFRKIVSVRPVGLVQGPPGTGKTRFIAALAHYAITKGLARNVLLSSQSHEAVNTAAESLLKLFRKSGGDPSVLRVAINDEQVSDPIRSYHTTRVERGFKDRFQATFNERLWLAGKSLGLPREAVDDCLAYEGSVMPVARRLAEIKDLQIEDDSRVSGLRTTLQGMLARLGFPDYPTEPEGDATAFGLDLLDDLFDKHGGAGISADKLDRLLAIAKIGRDFVGSTSRYQRSFEPFLAGTRQIVVGTCVGLGRTSLGLTSTAFDLVIVDEAARCTASELLVPLQAARWAVLVGDQAQLEPQHRAEVVDKVAERTGLAKREIKRSDFDRVFQTPYGETGGARLHTQYRMLAPIGRLVSEAFYPDLKLSPGRTDHIVPATALPNGFEPPLIWVDTHGLGEAASDRKVGDTGSRTNRVEADVIVRLLERWCAHDGFVNWLEGQTDYPVGVGVICMYAAQRDLIRRNLLRSPVADHLDRHIKVGTVDSYQGKENPIVLVSLVRNNRDGNEVDGRKTIAEGFLAAPNRINVAASRAMDRLLFVGTRTGWRRNGPMGRLTDGFGRAVVDGEAVALEAQEILESNNAAPRKTHSRKESGNG